MSKPYDLDAVVECVKNLVEFSRCSICDKLEGCRWRYQCGHSACEDCIEVFSQCLHCLTPPGVSSDNQVQRDAFLSQRVNNISKLFNICQETFGIDIYTRQRVSDQLKVERELFPRCIQAPLTYSNKKKSNEPQKRYSRKSSIFFSGENTSPFKKSKMEDSYNDIENWLDDNQKKLPKTPLRKPFADISVNQFNLQRNPTPIKSRTNMIMEKVFKNTKSSKKPIKKKIKSRNTSTVVESQSLLLDKFLKPKTSSDSFGWTAKKFKDDFEHFDKGKKDTKDESGIEADCDLIVIDDSQSQVIDKDKEAWLAVLEAEKNNPSTSLDFNESEFGEVAQKADDIQATFLKPNIVSKVDPVPCRKVPFYKKSHLIETCNLCSNNLSKPFSLKSADSTKDVNITIESNSFVTTINLTTLKNMPKPSPKLSTSVQTDIIGLDKVCEVIENKYEKQLEDSEDLFTVEKKLEANSIMDAKNIEENLAKNPMNGNNNDELGKIVIEDSESDDAIESSIIQVTAEVHRPSDEMDQDVLREIGEIELQQRSNPPKRRQSPSSSNSSEKENFNPNRQKKLKLGKKNSDKKTLEKDRDIFKELNIL